MPRDTTNYALTKNANYVTMILHIVIVCLSMDIPSNMVILPQYVDDVKTIKRKNDNVA